MRRTAVLFPAAFLMSLAMNTLFFSVIFLWVDRFAVSSGSIGTLFALGYVVYLAGCALFHRIESALHPGDILVTAAFLLVGCCALIWFVPVLWAAAGGYIAFQFFLGFFWPPLMGWFATGREGVALNRAMGVFNLCWGSGTLLGPGLGGQLFSINPGLPFLAGLVCIVLLALVLLSGRLFLPDMRGAANRVLPISDSAAVQTPVADTPLRFPSWTGLLCVYAVFGLVSSVLPQAIRSGLGLSEAAAGNVVLLRGISVLIGFAFLGRFVYWHYRRLWILLPQLVLFVLLALATLLPPSVTLYAVFVFLSGFAHAQLYFNSIFYGAAGSAHRGRRMAVHEAVLTLGIILGSLGGGWIYQLFGITGAFVFIFGIQTVGLIAALFLLRRTPCPDPRIGTHA